MWGVLKEKSPDFRFPEVGISAYVRIALATTDAQSILEVPETDEINMEDQTCLN